MDLLQNVPNTSLFVLQEKWRDQAAINDHMALSHFKEFMAKKDVLFDGPFEVTSMVSAPADVPNIDVSETLKVVLRLKAKAGLEEVIKKGVAAMTAMMRSQPGNLRYDMYQGFEGIYDTSVFILDQIWTDAESLGKAGQYLMSHMPFSLDDLAEPRQPITFEMISELE